jgi:predicted CDP-diglyceride synthetase/phosphatidate cytidylyltransferase
MNRLSVPIPVPYALLGAFALLIVASVFVMVLARLRPGLDYTELKLRIRT